MGDYDLAVVQPLLELHYDEDFANVIFNNKVDNFIKKLEMENDGGGAGDVLRVIDEGSVLASPDYTLAGGALGAYTFTVPSAKIEWKATVARDDLDAAKAKGGKAVFNVLKMAVDMAMQQVMRKLSRHCAANNAEIGTITAISGSTFTISKDRLNRTYKNMVFTAAAANGSGAVRGGASTPDTATMSSAVQSTGVITCTGAIPGTWQVGDTVWELGDIYGNQAKRRSVIGAFGWLDPVAASPSESFCGQDRSLAPNTLQPQRYDANGKPFRTALLEAVQQGFQNGCLYDYGFVPSAQWTGLLTEEDAREIVIEKDVAGKKITIGSQAIVIDNGSGSPVNIMQAPYYPSGYFHLLSEDFPFILRYTDKLIRFDGEQGEKWRLLEAGITDSSTGEKVPAYRIEGSFRGRLVHKGPGKALVGSNFTGA